MGVLRPVVPLGALLLFFVVAATLYSVVIPLGEGPDEPGHAAYVFFLARDGRLPVQRADGVQSDVQGEGHQPPLAYVLAVPMVVWLPRDERVIDLPGNPRFTWVGGDERNAVAHGSREVGPWHGAVLAWHLARLVSIVLGGMTVCCTYGAVLAFLGAGRRTTALCAAALLAVNPQFLFVSALVTNDAALMMLSAVLLWLVLDDRWGGQARDGVGEGGASFWRAGAIGLVLGLALLTKLSAVLLVPVACVGALWSPGRALRGGFVGGGRFWGSVGRVSIVLGCAFVVAGWWYVRNWSLYGDPLGLRVFQAEFATQPFAVGRLAAWRDALFVLHESSWARFGWMNVSAPVWLMGMYVALEVFSFGGWVVLFLRVFRRPVLLGYWLMRGGWVMLALPVLAFIWLVGFALTAGLVAWQGRLLFLALPAYAFLLALGVQSWGVLGGWWYERVVAFGLVVLAGVALWVPYGVIVPAYSWHTLSEARALGSLGTPTYGRFGVAGERGAELRGWQVVGEGRAGTAVEVGLVWYALGRQNRDWTVFVHVVDSHGQIVAEDNRAPQDGAFPMTQWVAGDWVADRHPLVLPPTLAAGSYEVRIGWYDQQGTQERAGVYDQQGDLVGDFLVVGRLVVQ